MIHQIAALSEHDELKSDADLLQLHANDLAIAHQFIPECWARLSDDEKITAITHMIQKVAPKDWLQSVRQMLLAEQVQRLKKDAKYMQLADTIDPFATGAMDLLNPTLAGFGDLSEHSKLATFSRVFFKETLVTMIDQGEKQAAAVLVLVRHCMTKWESFDPIECSEAARDAVLGFRNVCKFLEIILDQELGATHKDSFM